MNAFTDAFTDDSPTSFNVEIFEGDVEFSFDQHQVAAGSLPGFGGFFEIGHFERDFHLFGDAVEREIANRITLKNDFL